MYEMRREKVKIYKEKRKKESKCSVKWSVMHSTNNPRENGDMENVEVPKSENKIKPAKIYFPLDERIPPKLDPGHRDSR